MTNPIQMREWNAGAYHQLSGPQVSWGKNVLMRIRPLGIEVLLDAGCGTGRLTEELLQALPAGRVVGVDLSQNMLAEARRHLVPRFGAHVSFVMADLQCLPFRQVFDGIFSTAAFHWVPDHDRLFHSLLRALHPQGWLIAQCGGGPNLARLRQRIDEVAVTPRFAPFFAGFREPWVFNDAEKAAEILRNAGFVKVETSLEPALTILADHEKYCQFVRTMILRQHLECIPEAGLRDHFVAEVADKAAHDDPPFALDYWRLNLAGVAP